MTPHLTESDADCRFLETPLSEADVRGLRVGDLVRLSGQLVTARDAVHHHLYHGGVPPCDLQGAVVYHCGPIVVRRRDGWELRAAGPTTSIREAPYMADLIERFGLRAIIGKGGMGERTAEALAKHGCVYLHAVGGAAQALAANVCEVEAVYGYERFGAPEAVWQLNIRDFPALVTMDAHGGSLHSRVLERSRHALVHSLTETRKLGTT